MRLGPVLALCLACALACAGGGEEDEDEPEADADTDTDTDTDTDADADTDTDTDTDADTGIPSDFPADPSPFTVTVTGDIREDLLFDQPTCIHERGQFRMFWRNSSDQHEFVLIAEVLQEFAGAGSYDQTHPRAAVKLQEEAGGSLSYFYTDAAEGDTFVIAIAFANETVGWGELEVSSLSGGGASASLSPQPIPIWCPAFD
ncbi:MAG: hypothetical protein ACOZNI_19710 [Myxococcota bacterium]